MTKFQTRCHGYNDDEVKSALQKDIRRGIEDSAMFWAFELAHEDKSSFGWLRNRLKIIAYEDIGIANPEIVLQVSKAVDDMDFLYQNNNDEWQMILSHIILLMCRSKKSRIVDHFKESMLWVWQSHKFDIPDYALDMHTTMGNKMKRYKGSKEGIEHFIKESEKMENIGEVQDDSFYMNKAHKYWRTAKKWK